MQKIVTITKLKKRYNPLFRFASKLSVSVVSLLIFVSGCSNIECPLDNIVVMTCGLYSADTHEHLKLQETLDVLPLGKDTVLLNRASDITDFMLPLRQVADADTFLLRFTDRTGKVGTDTLIVSHANIPHYESIECPATVFHTLTDVKWKQQENGDSPLSIDSVALVRTAVNYDDVENLRIYLRSVAP